MNVAHTTHAAYPPKNPSPQLLISVQNQSETEQVIDLGIDLLDFKSPASGPLSPVDARLWHWAAKRIEGTDGRTRLSAALGNPNQAADCAGDVPHEFAFAKMGIEGLRTRRELTASWKDVRRQLGPATHLVAVAYADHHAACCPAPSEVFRLAEEAGLSHLLIDTFSKRGRSSIQNLGWQTLSKIMHLARGSGQFLTIAGSVRVEDAVQFQARGVVPDAFGIRGDATIGPRSGRISVDRIAAWQRAVAEVPA